jgi:hypothetical protein
MPAAKILKISAKLLFEKVAKLNMKKKIRLTVNSSSTIASLYKALPVCFKYPIIGIF